MDVKYDLDGYNCVTECPFGCRTLLYKGIINVGSTACNNCKYFVNDDDENHIVKCKYKDMEERTFKLSLDKAKQWYNGSNQDLKRIALEVYSEEELTKIELPNRWQEFVENQPSFTQELIFEVLHNLDFDRRFQALKQLEYLRDCYRQGWIPNWHSNNYKFCIQLYDDYIGICTNTYSSKFLSFQSPKIRDKFLENFKDLIKEAGDLI